MPTIKNSTQKLKALLAAAEPPKFLLVLSPDRVRRERILNNIFKQFVSGYNERSRKAENLRALEGSAVNAGNFQGLVDESNTLSLFSSRQFFLIQDAEEMPAALNKKIFELLAADNPQAFWFFSAAKFASNSQVLNFFKKHDALIELPELKGQDLNRWVQKELKSCGLEEWDEMLVESIAQTADGSPDRAADLIERLALYVEGSRVSVEDLARISKHSPHSSEFTLLDFLAAKKPRWHSELLTHQILADGKSPFALLGLISRTYINYLQIAHLREAGISQAEIRQKLNISPWIFNKQAEAAKGFSAAKLRESVKALLLADARLKNRSLGDEAILNALTYSL